jgi:hypothetical protein
MSKKPLIINRKNPLPHQYDFVYSNYDNVCLLGGYGSGKTEAGIMRAFNRKLMPDRREGWFGIYQPSYKLISTIAWIRIIKELNNLRKTGLTYKTYKQDMIIELNGGKYGSFIFRSMDKPESIIGYETVDAWVDEWDTLKKDLALDMWDAITERNRAVLPDDKNNTIGNTTTPEGFRAAYELFEKNTPDESYGIIRARTYDNPYINKNYIKKLLAIYTPQQQNAYLNGEFENITSGTVYKYFDKKTCNSIEEVISIPEFKETLYIGADFNIGGCVNAVAVERAGVYHIVDEIVSYDTYAMVDNILERYPDHPVVIYPDASGQNRKTNATRSDIQILKEHFQVVVDSSNPLVKDRVTSVNSAFYNGYVKVNIDKCPRHTESLEQHAYDPKTEAPEKFSDHPSIDDYTDNVGYLIVKLFPVHRPVSNIHRLSQTNIKH